MKKTWLFALAACLMAAFLLACGGASAATVLSTSAQSGSVIGMVDWTTLSVSDDLLKEFQEAPGNTDWYNTLSAKNQALVMQASSDVTEWYPVQRAN